jgi:predicted esterase
MRPTILLLLLLSCSSGEELPSLIDEQPTLPDGMTGLREYSSGVECPELTTPGTVMLQTPAGPRQVTWLFSEATPAPPEGRPLLMVFHGLGASAKTMLSRLQLQALADAGVVIAVPQGIRTARFGWGAGPKGIHDVMLVEDIRRCGYERLGVDLTRVHASGFSAGGLWTTLLLMHGSEILASAAVFSGGDLPPFVNYETPKIDVPALIIWGGETDAYRGRGFNVGFHGAALRVSEGLQRDGHFVVRCNHGKGHYLPPEFSPMLHTWTLAHRFGEPSPLTDWAQSEMQPGCEVMAPQ